MSLKRLAELVADCHRHFTYISDPEKFGLPEKWEDCSVQVRRGVPWQSDCEDWCISLLVLMLAEGFDPTKCGMAYVLLNGAGHAVAWYEDDAGGRWYMDCNNAKVRSQSDHVFSWVSYMRMSEPRLWHAYEEA